MKIGEFLKTDQGSHWKKSLSGFSGYCEVIYYSNADEYYQVLRDNLINFDEKEERKILACEAYYPDNSNEEFVIVIH